MISDFTSLLEKVRQLAELAQALRSENVALRSELATLSDDNARLAAQMTEARERVAALIAKLPTAATDQEAA